MKSLKMWKICNVIFCLVLVLSLAVAELAPLAVQATSLSRSSEQNAASVQEAPSLSVQEEGVVRPEDIDEGLSVQSLQDIRGRRVTIRQPIMEVVDDDVERPENVQVLSDTYTMRDLTTRDVMDELASVTFDGVLGDKTNPRYPMRGLENSPKTGPQKYFSEFEKYMLLRQAYYFNTHALEIVNGGKLAKHPAADGIYGSIPYDAKAVKMHIVTDPIYRSPMTTGLYLVPGEPATVTIKGLAKGETLQLYTHHQDTMGYLGYDENGGGFGKMESYINYWDTKILDEVKRAKENDETPDFSNLNFGIHGQWVWQNQKVPCMGTKFDIVGTGQDIEVKIGSIYGGPLYMQPTSSSVDMEISGAVLTPHFVLGVTTVEEFENQLRDAPGLIATLDVENGQLIGPAEDMRKCDDIEKLAYFWHSVFAIDISLNGRDYNYNMTMCYDIHVPAGEAVALNSNFCAQPTYWFGTCMNYQKLSTSGNWGTFHELGHVQAKTHGVNWGFCDGDGEVWNNTLILLIYSMLCNMDTRVVYVEHGEFVHPYTAIARSQTITKTYVDEESGETKNIEDYGQINNGKGEYFDQLSMYSTLLHSFGSQKFVDMFYTYKLNPAYCSNKRADFVYRIALVDRVNIMPWVNENYFANIKDDMFTDSQLKFIRSLPTFVPIAFRWANGIDGNETARRRDVDGKMPTVFDLSGDNITSPKPFEIVSVGNVRHGEIKYETDSQKVIYTPPKEITEYDSFDIVVKTEGGRQVTLNVNMRLLYRGSYTEVWNLGTTDEPKTHNNRPSVQDARDCVKDTEPDSTEQSTIAGKNDFTHNGILEYFRMQFGFAATQDGEHTFYLRADDASCVEFFEQKDGKSLGKMTTSTYQGSFSKTDQSRMCKINLQKGQIVYILAELVNWGGPGGLHIGVTMPLDADGNIIEVPAENLVSPGVTADELAKSDKFDGWQPRFVDSIKNATIDYTPDKNGWKVLESPACEGGCEPEKIVDGDETTYYHSKYNGKKEETPHIFVFDMNSAQTVNFFEIVRRGNVNDKLTQLELYGLGDVQYDESLYGGENNDKWTQLFAGANPNPGSLRYRLSFDEEIYRYFKLIVRTNASVTVIKEVYAGLQSQLNQTVKPSNYAVENGNSGFEENSANGKLTANASNAQYNFEFLGSGFELYADTNPQYGSALVTVDNGSATLISLADKPLFNKCVFKSGELKMGKHTVKVVTQSQAPFNISFVNVVYGTPVAQDEYPATVNADGTPDFGDTNIARQFSREWRTYVKNYKDLTSIKFLQAAPDGYEDTFIRMDSYIRVYRSTDDDARIAFVYPGKILSPTECGSLFAGCSRLEELDMQNFDVTDVRGAVSMFNGCSSLAEIKLDGVHFANVSALSTMFANCGSLQSVDMSQFTLADSVNIYNIFENCTNLQTITLPKQFNGEITCALPYVYLDETANTCSYTLTLNAQTAGHVLKLHTTHDFSGADCVHQEKAPTCTEKGNVAYKTCTTCKFNFADGDVLLRGDEIEIPATGHYYVFNPYYENPDDPDENASVWATCTEPGYGGHSICEYCGDVSEETITFEPYGHGFELDTNKGDGKGYTVEFDSEGIMILTLHLICNEADQNTIDWFNMDFSKAEYCNETRDLQIKIYPIDHQPATCEDDEVFYFDSTIDEANVLEVLNDVDGIDQIKHYNSIRINQSVKVVDALGHDWENIKAVPATCTTYGVKEGRICNRCQVSEGFGSLEPLGHDLKTVEEVQPTCAHHGHTAGVMCSRCEYTPEGSKAEIIPALGHKPVVVHGTEPTCTETGLSDKIYCSVCNEILEEQRILDPLGHTEEVVTGKAPTCTESGLKDGKRCSVCGETLLERERIEPLGHIEEDVPGKAATQTESGLTEGKRCSVCGEILQAQAEIPALGVQTEDEGGLSTGAVVGIGVGSAAGVGAIGTVVFVVIRRRKRVI